MRIAGWSIVDLVIIGLVYGCTARVSGLIMDNLVVHGVIDGTIPALLVATGVPGLLSGGFVAVYQKRRRWTTPVALSITGVGLWPLVVGVVGALGIRYLGRRSGRGK